MGVAFPPSLLRRRVLFILLPESAVQFLPLHYTMDVTVIVLDQSRVDCALNDPTARNRAGYKFVNNSRKRLYGNRGGGNYGIYGFEVERS